MDQQDSRAYFRTSHDHYRSDTYIMFSPAVLASWFRLKYPHIASGAIASSAPILEFDDVVPLDSFYHIVSNDFKV
jgi:hypothetical protein